MTTTDEAGHLMPGRVLLLGLDQDAQTVWSEAAVSAGAVHQATPDLLACEGHALSGTPTVVVVAARAFAPRLADPGEPAFGRIAVVVVSDQAAELPLWGWVGWGATAPPASPDEAAAILAGALTEAALRRDEADLLNDFRQRQATLNANEERVFDEVCAGRLNKQIANDLAVSVRTVEQRRRRLFDKMGVESAVPLAALRARVEGVHERIRRQRPRVFSGLPLAKTEAVSVPAPKFLAGTPAVDGANREPRR